MNSSRFPGKVLMNFCGKPMLLFQLEILRQFNLQAEIVVATSENPLDDQIEELCQEHRVHCVRGDEANVFQRFCLVAEQFRFDHIARLTGDNPFTYYPILKTCVSRHYETCPDLTSTRRIRPDHSVERYVPKGKSVDVINSNTLLNINQDMLDDFEKEHVIPVFFDGNYEVSLVKDIKVPEPSFSVDTLEDFEQASHYAHNLSKSGCLLQKLGFVGDDLD